MRLDGTVFRWYCLKEWFQMCVLAGKLLCFAVADENEAPVGR